MSSCDIRRGSRVRRFAQLQEGSLVTLNPETTPLDPALLLAMLHADPLRAAPEDDEDEEEGDEDEYEDEDEDEDEEDEDDDEEEDDEDE
jgi:hypothetical protein